MPPLWTYLQTREALGGIAPLAVFLKNCIPTVKKKNYKKSYYNIRNFLKTMICPLTVSLEPPLPTKDANHLNGECAVQCYYIGTYIGNTLIFGTFDVGFTHI